MGAAEMNSIGNKMESVTEKESNQSSILEHLGGMPEDAKHCALLAATTLHRALRNFAIGKKDK